MKKVIALLILLCMSTVTYAQDWANLNRFKAANDSLPPPNKNETRVVFMGNSITESWRTVQPEFFQNPSFINRGISGQTSPQMLLRFRQDVIALQPKVVVILAGTNDIAGNTGPSTVTMIMDNIASMAELAKANGIQAVLSSVLPAFDYPWKPGLEPAEKIVALNTMIQEYCKQHALIYLDYFSAMKDETNGLPKMYSEDGVHPNKAGYEIMAPLAKAAIKEAINQ